MAFYNHRVNSSTINDCCSVLHQCPVVCKLIAFLLLASELWISMSLNKLGKYNFGVVLTFNSKYKMSEQLPP